MSTRRKHYFEIIGWTLFTLSAMCFMLSGLMAGDPAATAGSVLFFIACFFFMRPLLARTSAD